MQRTRILAFTLTAAGLVGAAFLPAPAGAEETSDLVVTKLRVRLRAKTDSCALKVRLPRDPVLDTFDIRTDALAIDVGPLRLFELPAPESRTRLRERKALRWTYREGRRGPRLTLDLAFRTVKLVVRKADLDQIAASADGGVRVAVTLGDHVFSQVVDVESRRRKLVLAPPPTSVEDPGGSDPGGSEPPTPGEPVVVRQRVLALGGYSGIETRRDVVARTQQEFAALWGQHQRGRSPADPIPSVDFSREMVVGVFLGNRSSPAHSIELRDVRSDGVTTTVRVSDARITSGQCVFPAVVVQPHALIAVPRTDVVRVSPRVEQRTCP